MLGYLGVRSRLRGPVSSVPATRSARSGGRVGGRDVDASRSRDDGRGGGSATVPLVGSRRSTKRPIGNGSWPSPPQWDEFPGAARPLGAASDLRTPILCHSPAKPQLIVDHNSPHLDGAPEGLQPQQRDGCASRYRRPRGARLFSFAWYMAVSRPAKNSSGSSHGRSVNNPIPMLVKVRAVEL